MRIEVKSTDKFKIRALENHTFSDCHCYVNIITSSGKIEVSPSPSPFPPLEEWYLQSAIFFYLVIVGSTFPVETKNDTHQ